ncbi:hypothetical protein ASPZODRAFT_28213 [Penicilliopsis zonata CBS 506.65]|uniref:Receptor L-domain domain-containing protein n=1 Tax=Penicilliopsis zonata CBS 506.65 TaxID=1073090 RepID=A0A1L9S8R0_9EURO|nr:hypothetical protein ASPZODRAFT_28213 [Penicilliopsis zonata CBS 506.65]OJJ43545.1 hypothetical protein ASPZODRAFT_28213 [Penicilliopsis zonata CBS 506.65]
MCSQSSLLLAIAAMILSVAANNCSTGSYVVVSDQTELDAALAGCSSFGRNIVIGESYDGVVDFANVTHFSGEIGSSGDGTPNVTEILLPDAVECSSLDFSGMTNFRNISAPNLSTITSLREDSSTVLTVDLPEVSSAAVLEIAGHSLQVNMAKLENVTVFLQLTNGDSSDAFAVDLPALRYASELSITGSLSRISLPALDSVQDSIEIGISGDAIDLTLPRLKEAGSMLNLQGNFSSIELPSLVEATNATIQIEPSAPLSLNFTHLVRAGKIVLTGEITDVHFPVLESVDSISITSSTQVNCTGYYQAVNRTHLANDGESACSGISANQSSSSDKKASEGTKIGVGVGAGVGGLLVLLGAWLL